MRKTVCYFKIHTLDRCPAGKRWIINHPSDHTACGIERRRFYPFFYNNNQRASSIQWEPGEEYVYRYALFEPLDSREIKLIPNPVNAITRFRSVYRVVLHASCQFKSLGGEYVAASITASSSVRTAWQWQGLPTWLQWQPTTIIFEIDQDNRIHPPSSRANQSTCRTNQDHSFFTEDAEENALPPIFFSNGSQGSTLCFNGKFDADIIGSRRGSSARQDTTWWRFRTSRQEPSCVAALGPGQPQRWLQRTVLRRQCMIRIWE